MRGSQICRYRPAPLAKPSGPASFAPGWRPLIRVHVRRSVGPHLHYGAGAEMGGPLHLAVLRRCGLVMAERRQRHAIYRLTSPAVAQLVESLSAVAGPSGEAGRPTPELAEARTCYDHLAGRLGVRLFEGLLATRVLTAANDARGGIGMGPAGTRLATRLGIDLEAAARSRRRFAYACLDWTEQRFHLGGALGAALCDCFRKRGWLVRRPETRAVRLTPEGRRAIQRLLAPRA